MKPASPRRIALITLAFLIPPCIVGPLLMLSTVSKVMVHRPPSGVTMPTGDGFAPRSAPQGKPLVLIVMGAYGTQTFELLAAADIFKDQSLIIGPRRTWLPTTGAVAVLPDLDFRTASAVDVMILPSMVGAKDPELLSFVREWAPRARVVLTLGQGSDIAELAELKHPKLIRGGALKDSLPVLRALQTQAKSTHSLDSLKPENLPLPLPKQELTTSEQARLFLNAGFDWTKKNVGLWLDPSVSALSLAMWLDSIPRTLSSRAFTFNEERSAARLQGGVIVLPTDKLRGAPFPDRLVWLGSDSTVQNPAEGTDLHRFLVGLPLTQLNLSGASLDSSEAKSLEVVRELEDSAMESVVARLTQSRLTPQVDSPILPLSIWYRVPLLGFLGAFCFWMWSRRKPGSA